MRSLAAVVVVSMFATGLASAQMKVTQQPRGNSQQSQTLTPTPVATAPLESARRIKREDAMKLVKAGKAVYVDVRSRDSYNAGHIKGALSIPESEILSRLKEIPPGRMIITYCA